MNRRRFLKLSALGAVSAPAIVRAQSAPNALSFLDACNYHPTAVNWASRVVANGGAAPSTATVIAISTFMYALDAVTLTSKMLSVNVYAPDNLIAAITPLIKTAGNDPWSNFGNNFGTGDLSINGLTGNATTKVLNTGVVPSTSFVSFSGGISVYTFTLGSSSSGYDVGSASNTTPDVGLSSIFTPNPNGNTIFDFGNGSTSRISVSNSGWHGFTCANRTDSTHGAVYIASSTHAFSTLGTNTNDISALSMPTVTFSAHGYTSGVGTPTANSNRTISFIAIHSGLSSSDAQNLYNAVQALRTALGGGFI